MYAAPKVRTVCVLPGWTATKMSKGHKNKSAFMSPTLRVDAVAEAIVKKVLTGSSGIIIVPKIENFLGWTLRCWPMWLQTLVRRGAIEYVIEMGKGTEG